MPAPAAEPFLYDASSRARRLIEVAGSAIIYFGLAWFLWEFALGIGDRHLRLGFIAALGTLGAWRYGWLLLNIARATYYRLVVFPATRARANRMPDSAAFPSDVFFIVPTYREQPWVTRRMLASIARETAKIPSRVRLYIATGSPEEDAVVQAAFSALPANSRLSLELLRQSGKRSGMADSLRLAAKAGLGKHCLVALMDGDTVLGPGLLRRSIPLFALSPDLGGLTTNNIALTRGPAWYQRWYALRFALRNRYMCSLAVGGKILTLTGRFSIVRGAIAFGPEFIERIENDSIDHWLHGRIEFKTGDDKSTWFTLLRQGWKMTYVPDAFIYCMENAGERPFYESVGKMRRWFGNMLRNNGRALALGPGRTGLFTWFSLLDQRISMWTSLVLPTSAILLAILVTPMMLLYVAIWVLITRFAYLCILAIEGHRLSVFDVPLLIYQQWVGSVIKIQTLSNLRRQKWADARGDASGELRDWLAHFQVILWIACFVLIVAWMSL
jgi:glycosyltransferase Alg8